MVDQAHEEGKLQMKLLLDQTLAEIRAHTAAEKFAMDERNAQREAHATAWFVRQTKEMEEKVKADLQGTRKELQRSLEAQRAA